MLDALPNFLIQLELRVHTKIGILKSQTYKQCRVISEEWAVDQNCKDTEI